MAFLCSARVRRNKKTKGLFIFISNVFLFIFLLQHLINKFFLYSLTLSLLIVSLYISSWLFTVEIELYLFFLNRLDLDKPPVRQPILGRITGSASIETLVRVGIEKENGLSPDSKMVVLHDFNPCVDDELEVKRGQIVDILYQEKGWIYVIAENNQEGFIPHSYCSPIGSHLADLALNVKHKKAHRLENTTNGTTFESTNEINHNNHHSTYLNISSHHNHHHNTNNSSSTQNLNNNNNIINSNLNVNNNHNSSNFHLSHHSSNHLHHHHHHHSSSHHLNHHYSNSNQSHEEDIKNSNRCQLADNKSSTPTIEVSPFNKDPSGHYIVLFTFIARDENDVSVERGESVTVLNKDDSDWYWIVRSDGQEGFVPSAFLCPFEMIQGKNVSYSN